MEGQGYGSHLYTSSYYPQSVFMTSFQQRSNKKRAVGPTFPQPGGLYNKEQQPL